MTRKSNNFNTPAVARRARKKLRLKSGKKASLSLINQFWKDYINLSLIPSLIKNGKVQIDKKTSIEIVGKREIKLIKLKKGHELSSTTMANKLRPGISYKIVYTDTNHKGGVLIYKATPMIKKAVSEALMNTNTYYRIAL